MNFKSIHINEFNDIFLTRNPGERDGKYQSKAKCLTCRHINNKTHLERILSMKIFSKWLNETLEENALNKGANMPKSTPMKIRHALMMMNVKTVMGQASWVVLTTAVKVVKTNVPIAKALVPSVFQCATAVALLLDHASVTIAATK